MGSTPQHEAAVMSGQESLFDIAPAEAREARIVQAKWGGRKSTNARKICRAMLPHACRRCGVEILPSDPETTWHAGHREDRAAGGTEDGIEPEHATCNTSAGGRLGASITNARHNKTADVERVRAPQWW